MKILLLTLLFTFTFTQELNKMYNYKDAKELALSQNKKMLLVMKTQNCPYCKKLVNYTMEQDFLKEYINKNYVLTLLDKNRDIYPDKFWTNVVPVSYVVDPKTEDYDVEIIGYLGAEEYYEELK